MATVSSECASDNELLFPEYETDGFYDEMFDDQGRPRARAEQLGLAVEVVGRGRVDSPPEGGRHGPAEHGHHLQRLRPRGRHGEDLALRPHSADHGICQEWKSIEEGLKQRIRALNLFIDDMYHEQKIVRDGVFPEYMVQSSKCFLKPLRRA